MPPPMFLNPAEIDLKNILFDGDYIRSVNPHRFEFALLDAVVHCDRSAGIYAGYHDVALDAWWVRGHIPGRPLFPGVLMIEAAAQLASFMAKDQLRLPDFIGFTGVENVRFRGVVSPPCKLLMIGKAVQIKPRRIISDVQGFVNDSMVFEGTIIGMPI